MLNLKLCSQMHFRTKLNIYDGAFFTLVKPYFKNVHNSIKLPLGSIFYTTHPFVKKTYNSENLRGLEAFLIKQGVLFLARP